MALGPRFATPVWNSLSRTGRLESGCQNIRTPSALDRWVCWGHCVFPGGRKVTEKARTWARLAYSPRGGWRGSSGVLWGLMLTRGWMQEWGRSGAPRAADSGEWAQKQRLKQEITDDCGKNGPRAAARGLRVVWVRRRRPPLGRRVRHPGLAGCGEACIPNRWLG